MTLTGGVAFGQADGGLDLVGHRRNDGVEVFGPVQSDGRNGRFRLVQHGFELASCVVGMSSSRVTSVSEGRRSGDLHQESAGPYRKLYRHVAHRAVGHRNRRAARGRRRPRTPGPRTRRSTRLQRCQGRPGRGRTLWNRRNRNHRDEGSRRDRRRRRRLRALHAAGRDEPDGRARRHLPAAGIREECGLHGGDRR